VTGAPKNLTARIARLIGIANESRKRATMHGVVFELPTKAERQRARRILLRLYRWQWKRVERKELASVHPLVWQTVNDWGFRIFAAPDPILALEHFLGARQRPGKRARLETAERDFEIAVAVFKKMNTSISPKNAPSGARVVAAKRMSLEKAAKEVASEYGLERETVQKIYKLHRKEVRADAAMGVLERAGAGVRALLTK
jgi:hypothetical protein